jgi:uncharacterized membrane protein
VESTGWEIVRFLHVIAMAFFVGGQIVFGVAAVPALRGEADRERLRAVARRFGWGSLVALAVLIATGIPMADNLGLWGVSTLQVKLGFVVLTVGLVLAHLRFGRAHALQAAILVASLTVVWLGLDLAG